MQAVRAQPVVAVIHASADFLAYSGGVFGGHCSTTPDDGDYSVLVVGYTSTYWVVRTSMGPSKAYVHLPMGVNSCGIANWASYPVGEFGVHGVGAVQTCVMFCSKYLCMLSGFRFVWMDEQRRCQLLPQLEDARIENDQDMGQCE